jgi:hypothetical protein
MYTFKPALCDLLRERCEIWSHETGGR